MRNKKSKEKNKLPLFFLVHLSSFSNFKEHIIHIYLINARTFLEFFDRVYPRKMSRHMFQRRDWFCFGQTNVTLGQFFTDDVLNTRLRWCEQKLRKSSCKFNKEKGT